MEVLSTSEKDLAKAAAALTAGSLVVFPTETVYGLGGDAFNTSALAKIFEVKKRPRFDPLIIHIAEREALSRIADIPSLGKAARKKLSVLSQRLWPGPLTVILPKRQEVPGLATAALDTVAVRFPSHPIAQKLILLSTVAVAAPSANSFGCLSPTRAEHVKTQLGDKVDIIIDGGRTEVGLESTVLDLTRDPPAILRHGGVSRETIEALVGPVSISHGPSSETPRSPGQMKSHYSPRTTLVVHRPGELDAIPVAAGEGRLYFSMPHNGIAAPGRTRVLSESSNLVEAAANFFDMLHELDSFGLDLIRAEEAPCAGLGEAINDRLRRAQQN